MRYLFLFIVLAGIGLTVSDSMAGQRCVVVIPRQGNEALVNTCNECRMVDVARARPTGGIQGKRNYAVPAKTRVDLTFNSPGKTRIFSDQPCRKNQSSAPHKNAPGANGEQCVKLSRLKSGHPALINSCPACRKVDLTYDIRDIGQRPDVKKLKPRGVVILTPHPDATDVRIRRETSCGMR